MVSVLVSGLCFLLVEVNPVAVLSPTPAIVGTDEPMDKTALVFPLLTLAFPPETTCLVNSFLIKVMLLKYKVVIIIIIIIIIGGGSCTVNNYIANTFYYICLPSKSNMFRELFSY